MTKRKSSRFGAFGRKAIVLPLCGFGEACPWWTPVAYSFIFATMLLAPAVGAAESGPTISDVSLGFQGIYKVGYWSPLRVTLEAGDSPIEGKLSVVTPDGDGVELQFEVEHDTIRIPANGTVTVARRIKFGRMRPTLTVRFTSTDGGTNERTCPAARLPAAVSTDSRLILSLGSSIGEEDWLERQRSGALTYHRRYTDAAELPADWLEYEGVDSVVIPTSQTDLLSALSSDQFDALERWLRMGGRLLLTLGSEAEELFAAPPESNLRRLSELIPAEFVAATVLRRPGVLDSYIDASQPLDTSANPVRVAMLANVRGSIELSASGVRGLQPLVIRAAHGFGKLDLVTLDLDKPPLSTWIGRTEVVAKLMADNTTSLEPAGQGRTGGRMAHVGFSDLSGQLRSALDQFSQVSFVPFYWVAGLVFIYTVLIGPADYFLLRRVVKRMHLTWITFPLIVLGVSFLAISLFSQVKSERLHVNQADLVDVDLGSRTIRGASWADIYSPRDDSYDLRWSATEETDQIADGSVRMVTSWLGLPGTGLGALGTSRALPGLTSSYQLIEDADGSRIEDAPIQVASTKSFQVRWWSQIGADELPALKEDENRLLRGEIRNPLPVELDDCAVLFGRWLYRLESTYGKLGPGESVRIETERPLNLEWRLTRRRVEGSRDVSTPWDQNSLDVPRILEMMMFHDAAGGEPYTGLTHRYQAFVDLSDQLARGRAVLLGRSTERSVELHVNDQGEDPYDRSWTYYRVLFPVELAAPGRRRQF